MTMKIIGSGLGRTGTKSLQTALNMLGMGPCHHMAEVFLHPETMPLWVEAASGNQHWDKIFADYTSAVDYSAAAYWRELAAYYPDARIIHTTRDAEAWYASTQATIFAKDGPILTALGSEEHPAAHFFESFTRPLAGRLNDKHFLIDYFHRHTEEVIAAAPPRPTANLRGWPGLGAVVPVHRYSCAPRTVSRRKQSRRLCVTLGALSEREDGRTVI